MSVCDVPGISKVCTTATDQASSIVTAPFKWVADALGATAKAMIELTWKVIDQTTLVDLTTSEFARVYNIIFGIAIFVMLGFFLLQVIGGMLRREPAALTRAVVGLAKSVLGSFLAVTLLATALEITDRLSRGIIQAAGTTTDEMGDRLAVLAGSLTAISTRNPSVAIILTIIVASLMIGATFMVWLSMLARKALLLIAVVLAPVALAGASWDHTRAWVGRWASFVIALIVSKLVVVVIFLLATSQVSAPIDADLASISEPLSGVVLLLIAGFAPYLTYKAINFMGFDMYHAMSAEQETKHALNRPLPLPVRQPAYQPTTIIGAEQKGADRTPPAAASSTPPSPAPMPSTGTSAAAPAAAGSAAPPAAAALAGATLTKETATAGPRLGQQIGTTADQQADTAQTPPSPPSTAAQHEGRAPRPPMPQIVDPSPLQKPGAGS